MSQLDALDDFIAKQSQLTNNTNTNDNPDNNLKKKYFDEWIHMKNKRLILNVLEKHKEKELNDKIFKNLIRKNKIDKMMNILDSNIKKDTFDLLNTLNKLKCLENTFSKINNNIYKKEFFDKLKNANKNKKEQTEDNNDNDVNKDENTNVIKLSKVKNFLKRCSKIIEPKQKYFNRWISLINRRNIFELLKNKYLLEKEKENEKLDADELKNQFISAIKNKNNEINDLSKNNNESPLTDVKDNNVKRTSKIIIIKKYKKEVVSNNNKNKNNSNADNNNNEIISKIIINKNDINNGENTTSKNSLEKYDNGNDKEEYITEETIITEYKTIHNKIKKDNNDNDDNDDPSNSNKDKNKNNNNEVMPKVILKKFERKNVKTISDDIDLDKDDDDDNNNENIDNNNKDTNNDNNNNVNEKISNILINKYNTYNENDPNHIK